MGSHSILTIAVLVVYLGLQPIGTKKERKGISPHVAPLLSPLTLNHLQSPRAGFDCPTSGSLLWVLRRGKCSTK